MRVAVLGVGRIGTHHARNLVASDRVQEVLIADVDTVRATTVAAEIGATAMPSVEAVFTGAPVDAVVVATATAGHAELVTTAVSQGIPVFCEKPVATTIAETVRIADLVASSGVPVVVGFQRRSDPAYRALRARISAGELGRPYLVRMVVGDEQAPPPGYLLGSGGIFRDQNIHDFDVLRWVTGDEVVSVAASGDRLTEAAGFVEADDVDTAATLLRLRSGALAVLTSSRDSAGGYDVRLEVAGSRQTVAVGVENGPHAVGSDGVAVASSPQTTGFIDAFAAAYATEVEEFLDVVAGTRAPGCTVQDGLAAALIADAVDSARRTGVWVDVARAEELVSA